jgi:hypothetical protein
MKATKLPLQTTQFSILSKFRAPFIADGSLFSENSQIFLSLNLSYPLFGGVLFSLDNWDSRFFILETMAQL